MAELLANPKICGDCQKPGCELKCACKLVFYCGKECQKAHWPIHKKDCRLALARNVKDVKKEWGRDHMLSAMTRMQAGAAHKEQGRLREAEQCFLEARRIYAENCGEESELTANMCQCLAEVYQDMGRLDEAVSMCRESVRIHRNASGKGSEALGIAYHGLGSSLGSQLQVRGGA
jgi:tetratricopeptide (TPR) repeat protein